MYHVTIFEGLIAAVAWPATLITAAGVIDNPWGVCLQRAVQVILIIYHCFSPSNIVCVVMITAQGRTTCLSC